MLFEESLSAWNITIDDVKDRGYDLTNAQFLRLSQTITKEIERERQRLMDRGIII
tara:strand:- start:5744 stop:5908 length:165 start_codon:yes stop_codon:yes gene_type:complete